MPASRPLGGDTFARALPSYSCWAAYRSGIPDLFWGSSATSGLFFRRLTDPEMREYSCFSDYFNLLYLPCFSFRLYHLAVSIPAGRRQRPTFSAADRGPSSTPSAGPKRSRAGGHRLASLLVAYIPLTHMSHMFMKYFLYHEVKWDDAPNLGAAGSRPTSEESGLKPTWEAKHIEADGQKSWGDIASPAPKEKK